MAAVQVLAQSKRFISSYLERTTPEERDESEEDPHAAPADE